MTHQEKPAARDWSADVAPEFDYELQEGESLEAVDTRMKETGEPYNIWLPGTKGKHAPARMSRGRLTKEDK